ncbi:precorrin-6A synthase (deacetylating) [Aureimonas populi]|uniref:Precorrin-6A synthase [deacetylating] n=1 Tax=Aureimonas populi TaxID=1701758 RepID=A0ABW5CJ71_9HYPH|nr:precorrin-6A synthase (deacetylating) [Aureimonas populi]
MRTVLVIGIGTGNPEHMTVQAINALNRADLVLLPKKGEAKEDLAQLRREICRLYLRREATRIVEFDLPSRDEAEPAYGKRVADWHGEIARLYEGLIAAYTGEEGTVALLVWGDPSLYDSTLRILDRLEAAAGWPLRREVVPGIASIQALCASHGVALNTVGGAVHVTTGRRLRAGETGQADTIVVLLDGETSFLSLPPGVFDIHWGAYLGTPDEILLAGPLEEVAPAILAARREAQVRKGWIMDTYILRRRAA